MKKPVEKYRIKKTSSYEYDEKSCSEKKINTYAVERYDFNMDWVGWGFMITVIGTIVVGGIIAGVFNNNKLTDNDLFFVGGCIMMVVTIVLMIVRPSCYNFEDSFETIKQAEGYIQHLKNEEIRQ